MAGFQIILFVSVLVGIALLFKKRIKYQKLLLVLLGFVLLVIINKFITEEWYPCHYIDKQYCDYSASAYHPSSTVDVYMKILQLR